MRKIKIKRKPINKEDTRRLKKEPNKIIPPPNPVIIDTKNKNTENTIKTEKTLTDFRNIHKEKSCIICGLGESLNDFSIDVYKKCYTIGVNDIERFFTPTYLLYVDNINKTKRNKLEKQYKRTNNIINSNAEYIFLYNLSSNYNFFDKERKKKLVEAKSIHFQRISQQNSKYNYEAIYHTKHSTFPAITLALYMGFNRIGIIGVDFDSNHAFGKTGQHVLQRYLGEANAHLSKLKTYFPKVEFVNFSKKSKITSFEKVDNNYINTFFINNTSANTN